MAQHDRRQQQKPERQLTASSSGSVRPRRKQLVTPEEAAAVLELIGHYFRGFRLSDEESAAWMERMLTWNHPRTELVAAVKLMADTHEFASISAFRKALDKVSASAPRLLAPQQARIPDLTEEERANIARAIPGFRKVIEALETKLGKRKLAEAGIDMDARRARKELLRHQAKVLGVASRS